MVEEQMAWFVRSLQTRHQVFANVNEENRRMKDLRKASLLRSITAVILTVAALIGAITTLLFAIGKLPDAYYAACKLVPCPIRLAWIDDGSETVSHYVRSDTVFELPHLVEAPSTGPIEGSQRYLEPPQATCAGKDANVWKLHNGTVILDNDPLLTQGWISPSWVGEPEPPDWEKFDKLAIAMFGWTPGFSKNNRCSANSRCKLSPDEIKQHSERTVVSVDRCGSMRMGGDYNFSHNRSSLAVTIIGKADEDSLWSVSARKQTYLKFNAWSGNFW
jgi:hypothetical protein